MVTLQVLVLSFWVRIPVTQQNALIGCVLDADHRRIFFISAFRNTEGARRAMTPPLLSALCFLPLHHTYGFSEISG